MFGRVGDAPIHALVPYGGVWNFGPKRLPPTEQRRPLSPALRWLGMPSIVRATRTRIRTLVSVQTPVGLPTQPWSLLTSPCCTYEWASQTGSDWSLTRLPRRTADSSTFRRDPSNAGFPAQSPEIETLRAILSGVEGADTRRSQQQLLALPLDNRSRSKSGPDRRMFPTTQRFLRIKRAKTATRCKRIGVTHAPSLCGRMRQEVRSSLVRPGQYPTLTAISLLPMTVRLCASR